MRLRNTLIATTILVAGTLIGATTQHFAAADVTSGDRPVLVPVETCRIADTRAAPNTVGPKSSPLAAADTMTVNAQQAGTDCVGKIPATASALSLNVTALNATSNSFITIWPEGPLPTASALNPEPGTRVFNAVTTELTAAQTFQIYNNRGSVDVFVDINGYYDNHNHDDLYYTQTDVDAALAPKADSADVYSKSELGAGYATSSGHVTQGGSVLTFTGSDQTVATLDLPAGSYLVTASVVANNNAGAQETFGCELRLNTTIIDSMFSNSLATLAPNSRESVAFTGAGTLTAPGTANVVCRVSTTSGNWLGRSITAVQVATLEGDGIAAAASTSAILESDNAVIDRSE